jgi:hypothetical protein
MRVVLAVAIRQREAYKNQNEAPLEHESGARMVGLFSSVGGPHNMPLASIPHFRPTKKLK